MPAKSLTIALVAGEASGDNLGAPLLREVGRLNPGSKFIGIGGPNMIKEGLESWVPIDRLSVNGFVDPLLRLPELLRILLATRDRILSADVDCFVGIDFNFFNLILERMLKRRGVKTIHYVSPTVWAWRKGRIRSIARAVDLMLALYPFETDIYDQHGIPVRFVGHPKADEIDPEDGAAGKGAARVTLGYAESDRVVAMLPGSRGSEVKLSGPDFLAAALLIQRAKPETRFVIPAANDRRKAQIEQMLAKLGSNLDIKLIDGQSTLAMQAADVVLVNSGTATLEALLLKRPMVMSYRLGAVTYWIVSRLVTTPYFALPNILAGKLLVPELIQDQATPAALAAPVIDYLEHGGGGALIAEYDRIHRILRCNAGRQAATAVIGMCQ
jgi:lipid-A-disaccharide synthase